VSEESAFISTLRSIAGEPEARGLLDDAATLCFGGRTLVLTHDMIVEGVHFLAGDPAEDVAWKLVAVNLSDLAAKGATPLGVLLGYTLTGHSNWDDAFVVGLGKVLHAFGTSLLGGDTVSAPPLAPRSLGLTAIGEARHVPPARSGAKADDLLWISGKIGDAGAGLRIALGEIDGPPELVARYRRPQPRLELGQNLAPLVSAMMDVSDGLLIDAARMAQASGLAASIDLAEIPLSEALLSLSGGGRQVRIDAATAGDDYELLFAAPAERTEAIREISAALGLTLTPVGSLKHGEGIVLTHEGTPLPLPRRLGYQHAAGPA
jgi:thiamine-monophosphate kinase